MCSGAKHTDIKHTEVPDLLNAEGPPAYGPMSLHFQVL